MFRTHMLHFQIFVVLLVAAKISSKIEFTNIKCKTTDAKFGDFEFCYIKSVNRTYKFVSMKYNFHENVISKINVDFALFKHNNGWRPFLYNLTIDGCKFLTNPEAYPIVNYLYNIIVSNSNMNHSCPFYNYLIFDKITGEIANRQVVNILPFAGGHYMLQINWNAHGALRAVTKFYATYS